MFGTVSCGIPGERFEHAVDTVKAERGVILDTELDIDALGALTARLLELYEFPQDPPEQLRLAIRAVFDRQPRQLIARRERRLHGAPITVPLRRLGKERADLCREFCLGREVAVEDFGSGDHLLVGV
jgi:hypothetical protein